MTSPAPAPDRDTPIPESRSAGSPPAVARTGVRAPGTRAWRSRRRRPPGSDPATTPRGATAAPVPITADRGDVPAYARITIASPYPVRRGVAPGLARLRAAVRSLDLVLVGAVGALSTLGVLLVWSASRSVPRVNGGDPMWGLKRQAMFVVIGLAFAVVTAGVGHRTLRGLAPWLYLATLAGLLAVLTPLGTTVNGAHSWIPLPGGFALQPAEAAKVGVVLALATVLAQARVGVERVAAMDVAAAAGVVGAAGLLVLLQPDFGTAVVLGAVGVGVLVVAGVRWRWLAALLAAAAAAGAAAVALGLVQRYQIDRLTTFLDPNADPLGAGWTVSQAKSAISAGGLLGQGIGQGARTQAGVVPEAHTDFIASVAGEELGLLGLAAVIVLLGVVVLRALRIAARARDAFGALIATGVAVWFAVQGFENVGMCLGLMPVTGIPLPFVSYGGSATIACFVAVGLLLNVHAAGRRR